MFSELKVFNGGTNNLVAAHHIQPNQGVYIANANIQSGEVVSAKEPKATGDTLLGNSVHYYKAQDEVVSSTEDRFYVEWAGLLYWSNAAGVLKRYDGTSTLSIGGHIAPASVPTLAISTAGLLNGTYTYTVTYVHSNAFESPPCDFGTVAPANNKTTITFTDTPPASATHRKIYRSGGLNPTFNLVATLPIATAAYTDNIHDFDVSRSELSTYNSDPAPTNLDMLIETEGTFFGAVGNKVHFSKQGQPEYWSDYNFVQLPKGVAGLGAIGTSVVAWTEDEMYMISGKNISNISLVKLPFDYGCKDKRTVKNIDGRLVWVSSLDTNDAVCIFDGSSVQIANKLDTQINSANIGSLSFDSFGADTYDTYSYDIQAAAVSNHKYFLFMDGRTAILDFEDGLKIYYNVESVNAAYSKNSNLYISISNTVYDYIPDFGQYRNVSYRTGDIDNGDATRYKQYRYIKVNATGAYKVHVFVDGVNIMQTETEKSFLPTDIYGRMLSFLIETDGYAKIKSISYEYDYMKD